MREQTAATLALIQLLQAAMLSDTQEASRLPEGRLPQLRNQTVHASKTEEHYKNAFEKLEEKYPNPAPLDAFTFEEICLGLTELKAEERQDAFSQFRRLQREGEQKRINVLWAAVSSLNDPDAVLSFIKGGFVGPWRIYWDMKSETEKNRKIQEAGGEAAIQAEIRRGSYNACLGGSRIMLLEPLAGIHPDAPLFMSEEDSYNLLLKNITPFIERMKAGGKGLSQFWELFKQENLTAESPIAAHQAFRQLQTDVTDELLEGYFEE